MLYYPKIPDSRHAPFGRRAIAFEKCDGTNVHFRWERAAGWSALGTRRDRFALDPTGEAAFRDAHPELRETAEVFRATLAGPLGAILERLTDCAGATCFAELLGDGSFAGRHHEGEPKRLVLFDVERDDSGFVAPEAFLRDFAGLPLPRVLWRGKLTGQVTQEIRDGRFGSGEGVVPKGVERGEVWRCKVKTDAYRARLKAALGDDWESGWE